LDEQFAVESDLRTAPEVGCEVLPGVSRRREWSTEEKLRILAQSVAPGSSPTLTCRMHGISSGQFYTWRKQFRNGTLTGFMPVSIASLEPVALPSPAPAGVPATVPPPSEASIIEVEAYRRKTARPGDVDEAALRGIFRALS
jgi:transposase